MNKKHPAGLSLAGIALWIWDEQEEEAAAAQENTLQAQAAALHALLEEEPNQPLQPDRGDELPALVQSQIEHVNLAQKFIEVILAATLNNENLEEDVIKHLQSLEEGPVDISDANTRLALNLFMACKNSSKKTYSSVRKLYCGDTLIMSSSHTIQ